MKAANTMQIIGKQEHRPVRHQQTLCRYFAALIRRNF